MGLKDVDLRRRFEVLPEASTCPFSAFWPGGSEHVFAASVLERPELTMMPSDKDRWRLEMKI